MANSGKTINLAEIQQQIEVLREIEDLLPRRQDIIDLRDELNSISIPEQIEPGEGVEKLREAIKKAEEKIRFYSGSILATQVKSGNKIKRKTGLAKKIKSLLSKASMTTLSRADLMEALEDEGFQSNSINSSIHALVKKGDILHDKVRKKYSLR